jgi:hypothetical protein
LFFCFGLFDCFFTVGVADTVNSSSELGLLMLKLAS